MAYPRASGRSRPRGTQHGETEGTLRGHSATFQELDFAQTSSCEDARRRTRKADETHKAVISLERVGSHFSGANVDERSSDLMDMAFAIFLKSSAVIRKAPLRNAKPQLSFPLVNVSSCSSGRTGACLLLKNFVRRRYGQKPADCSAS